MLKYASVYPEDGSCKVLRKCDYHLPNYTALHISIPWSADHNRPVLKIFHPESLTSERSVNCQLT